MITIRKDSTTDWPRRWRQPNCRSVVQYWQPKDAVGGRALVEQVVLRSDFGRVL